jgi:hypothetical protein
MSTLAESIKIHYCKKLHLSNERISKWLFQKKNDHSQFGLGIAIGVAISSMLVRYALQKKAQQTMDRPGHYKSLKCGADGSPFSSNP